MCIHPFLNLLNRTGRKPYIVDSKVSTNAGTPLTLTLPTKRHAGLLAIAIIINVGDTATPGTPTGWTSLASAAATATPNPGIRIAYKFLNGSEAPTLSSAATSASSMAGIIFTIGGVMSSGLTPTATLTAVASTSTPNPASVATTFPVNGVLRIVGFFSTGTTVTVTQWPIGFCQNIVAAIQNTLITYAVAANQAIRTLDPSAFTLTSSLQSGAYHILVRA